MLPSEIPLFPLPNVVLFPGTRLPLHIFEPRYRAMVADALAGERLIGMVLLRPGWEGHYDGRPPVYPVGCAGFMTHAERLDDGRFNILLRGLEKFRIVSEQPESGNEQRPYRVARVDTLAESLAASERGPMREARGRLEQLIARSLKRPTAQALPPDIADEDLVNALAQYLSLDPVEKQALLERDGLLARSRSLVELLEIKILATSGAGTSKVH